MGTTKLAVYNGALRLLGERRLASLTEERPPRYHLDDCWNDGLVNYCLEQGDWGFATRTVKLLASPSIDPDFGYEYGFQKPDDFVKTVAISTDEFFSNTLLSYNDEREYIFAPYDEIYYKYISDDAQYGLDLTLWPETFKKFVQAQAAYDTIGLITGSDGKEDRVKRALKEAKRDARSKDVMSRPQKISPSGSFVRARMQSHLKE